jgi:hypothetical protein
MRDWIRICLICALLLGANQVRGQARDPKRAEVLFEEARALVKAGKYESACPRFADSQRLDPAAGTLMNLADCQEHTSNLLSARSHWRALLQALPLTGDPRRALAQQRLEELQPKIPRLAIWLSPGAPAGAKVSRDGVELASTALGLSDEVDPGMHEVIVRVQGHQDRKYLIAVHPSQHLDQVVEWGARVEGTPPPIPVVVPTAPTPAIPSATNRSSPPTPTTLRPTTEAAKPSTSTAHKLGHWGIGLGATTLGVGLVMGGLVVLKKVSLLDSCPDHHCPEEQRDNYDSARSLAGWSTGAVIVGGVLLAGGIVLVSLPQPRPAAPTWSIGARANQVSLQGWF